MSTSLVISNVPNPAANYPGIEYDANETGAVYFEDREVNGILYRVQNASWTGSAWSQALPANAALPSYAMAQNSDGSVSFLFMPAHSANWTIWSGSGVRGVFNVKDYGAKGDGSTDDTTAINNAANAVNTAGGGVLYLPAGTYVISSVISLGNNTVMTGDGYAFTTLSAVLGGYTPQSWMINNSLADTGSGQPLQNDIYVQNLTVNGNGLTNLARGKALITLDAVYRCGVNDCQVLNTIGDGIRISCQGNTMGTWPGPVLNFSISNNKIDLFQVGSIFAGFPIRVLGASGGIIRNNIIGDSNDVSLGGSNDSIAPAGCSNMVIANNNIFNGGDGINSMACYDVTIIGNVIKNCKGYGIATFSQPSSGLPVSQISITGNVIDGAGKTGINVVDGTPSGSANDYVVANNVLVGSGMTPEAIHIQAYNGVVSGNSIDLQGGAYDGIGIQGFHCVCIGNLIKGGSGSGNGINLGASGAVSFCNVINNYVHDVAVKLNTIISNLTSCVIRNNININPPAPTIITQPPMQNTLYPNQFPFDCTVYIKAGSTGSISKIEVDGMEVLPASSSVTTLVTVRVPVSGTVKLTYTGSPTWVWIPE